jgi:hypothetical protein
MTEQNERVPEVQGYGVVPPFRPILTASFVRIPGSPSHSGPRNSADPGDEAHAGTSSGGGGYDAGDVPVTHPLREF